MEQYDSLKGSFHFDADWGENRHHMENINNVELIAMDRTKKQIRGYPERE